MEIQKWPSFNNIHKHLYDLNENTKNTTTNYCDDFFNINVTISIKIDGSNLGIHIVKNCYDKWYIKELIGRNSLLWNCKINKKINKNINDLPKYGNVMLKNLPEEMFKFSCIFADSLKLNEIIIYGETICVGDFASFHPFGYYTNNQKFKLLTSELYQQFNSIQPHMRKKNSKKIDTNDEIKEYLKNTKLHDVFPPPILFVGKLKDGINNLYNIMKNTTNKDFEGVFIVGTDNDNDFGFKWKTGLHEEQRKIPKLTDINFKIEEIKQVYQKLVDVYETKEIKLESKKILVEKSDNISSDNIDNISSEEFLKNMISISLKRELTKISSFEHVPKHQQNIVLSLTKSVVQEIKKQYTDTKTKIFWNDDLIEKLTKSQVNTYVTKIEYCP